MYYKQIILIFLANSLLILNIQAQDEEPYSENKMINSFSIESENLGLYITYQKSIYNRISFIPKVGLQVWNGFSPYLTPDISLESRIHLNNFNFKPEKYGSFFGGVELEYLFSNYSIFKNNYQNDRIETFNNDYFLSNFKIGYTKNIYIKIGKSM